MEVGLAGASRRAMLRGICIVAAGVVPWLVFATWYFGSPVPQSMIAKWSYHGFLPPLLATEQFWFLLLAVPFALPPVWLPEFIQHESFGMRIALYAPLPVGMPARRLIVLLIGASVLAVVCVGAIAMWRRNKANLCWLLFSATYIAAYCVARPHVFSWYLVPPLPMLMLTFVAGGTVLLQATAHAGGWRRPLPAVIGLALLSVAAWQCGRLILSFPSPRELAYRQAVSMVDPSGADRSLLIGALEIGTIGYYSRARIVDHIGIVSPEVLRLGVAGTIERHHPDFYIVPEGLFRLFGFPGTPAFSAAYRLVTRISPNRPDITPTLVFRRTARQPAENL